jgi:hypothetical protein
MLGDVVRLPLPLASASVTEVVTVSWLSIILLIVAVYVVVLIVRAIRDSVQLTIENRKDAQAVEKMKAKRQQKVAGGGSGLVPKGLRVRPEDTSRSSRPNPADQDRGAGHPSY